MIVDEAQSHANGIEVRSDEHSLTLHPAHRYQLAGRDGTVSVVDIGIETPSAQTTTLTCEHNVWTVRAAQGQITHWGAPVTTLLVGRTVEMHVDGIAATLTPGVAVGALVRSVGNNTATEVRPATQSTPVEHLGAPPMPPVFGSPNWFDGAVAPPSRPGLAPPPGAAQPPVPAAPSEPSAPSAPPSVFMPAALPGLSNGHGGATHEPASLAIRDLVVERGGHRRLDRVDLDLVAGEFLAVLGTSGAGKSTLLKAITAIEPATSGSVTFAGHDLYRDYQTVCRRIGYVPQDDILHTQLTVTETLRYAGQLRFPANTTLSAIDDRIDEVLQELGLVGRANARIDQLSGGQRKRVNVAVELLTRPDLLILDEPTSGLDPGNERAMMDLLRQLSDHGRIVVVVTHSVESLHLCDRVLFLANGGVPVFCGPPAALAPRFGCADITSVFVAVERLQDPADQRVARLAPLDARPMAQPTSTPSGFDRLSNASVAEFGRQFNILTSRYVHVIASDRRALLILAAQAPVLAVLMMSVFGSGNLEQVVGGQPTAGNVLMGVCLAAIYLGASNAVREIVKERAIFRRELSFGVTTSAYLMSKMAVLGAITVAQTLLLVASGTALQRGPAAALLLLQPKIEFFAGTLMASLAAVAMGLLISAYSSTADRAMTILPVLLFVQFLLAGVIFPVSTIGIQQLSWLTPSRWGLVAIGSTSDFYALRGCDIGLVADCSELWQHNTANWLLGMVMLMVLTGGVLYACWRKLETANPNALIATGVSTPP